MRKWRKRKGGPRAWVWIEAVCGAAGMEGDDVCVACWSRKGGEQGRNYETPPAVGGVGVATHMISVEGPGAFIL